MGLWEMGMQEVHDHAKLTHTVYHMDGGYLKSRDAQVREGRSRDEDGSLSQAQGRGQ
jgi:hypothetical protein